MQNAGRRHTVQKTWVQGHNPREWEKKNFSFLFLFFFVRFLLMSFFFPRDFFLQRLLWTRSELEQNRCHCCARDPFCMVTDADRFFHLHDMFAWQPLRVCNPNNPTLMHRRYGSPTNCQCIVYGCHGCVKQPQNRGGCVNIEQNYHSVSLSCITVIGSRRKSAMFFGESAQKGGGGF